MAAVRPGARAGERQLIAWLPGVIADTRTLGAPRVNDQRQVTESALFPIAHRQQCCYTCEEDAGSSMSGSRRSTVPRAPGCAPGSHEQTLNFLPSPGSRIPIGLLIFRSFGYLKSVVAAQAALPLLRDPDVPSAVSPLDPPVDNLVDHVAPLAIRLPAASRRLSGPPDKSKGAKPRGQRPRPASDRCRLAEGGGHQKLAW